ncbi:MAG TPA: hypothetical protein VII06_32155 [Chloroflexota bacterium]|jgi:hypothetical protein
MPPTDLTSFEAVAQLSADEQRQLVRSDAPVERLWAAWALGLRAGATALPELQLTVAQAPEPGVRGHLAIVLAGLGERELVQTLALHDPAELVRAVAGEHWLRTAPPATQLAGEPVVAQLLHDRSADVRLAVFRELLRLIAERQLPGLAVPELERLAADPKPAIRWPAVEHLAEFGPEAGVAEVFARRLPAEPDPALAGWLASRVIGVGQPERVLAALWGDGSERDEALFRELDGRGEQFSWNQLARLAGLGVPSLDTHLATLLVPGDGAALTWLLTCIVRAADLPPARSRGEAERANQIRAARATAEARLMSLLPGIPLGQASDHDIGMCRRLIELYETQLAHHEAVYFDEDEQPLEPEAYPTLAELRESDGYQYNRRLADGLGRLVSDDHE